MTTVLLGWSVGQGYGHVTKLVALGRALRARGDQCVLAVIDLPKIHDAVVDLDFPVVPAPTPRIWKRKGAPPPRCHTTMMHQFGFHEPNSLRAEVTAWDGLVDVVKPDVVVAENAPGLLLAAYQRIPVVAIGTGFSVPPGHVRDFPILFPQARAAVPNRRVLEVIAEVQKPLGRPVPPSVPALYDVPHVVGTLPELDLYAEHRKRDEVHAPFYAQLSPAPPANAEMGIFAYLSGDDAHLPAVLGGLGRARAPVEAFIRNARPEHLDLGRSVGIEVHERPRDFSEVLPRRALVVHGGGAGTAHAALYVGRPQLTLPRFGEAGRNAQRLQKLGVGVLHDYTGRPDWAAGFTRVLDATMQKMPALAKRSHELATALAQREVPSGVARTLEHIDALREAAR